MSKLDEEKLEILDKESLDTVMDYYDDASKTYHASADNYENEANETSRELSRNLILASAIIITISAPLLLKEEILLLSNVEKVFIGIVLFMLTASVILGIAYIYRQEGDLRLNKIVYRDIGNSVVEAKEVAKRNFVDNTDEWNDEQDIKFDKLEKIEEKRSVLSRIFLLTQISFIIISISIILIFIIRGLFIYQ